MYLFQEPRILLFVILSALLGCGSRPTGPVETYAVRGQLFIDGKPAENAYLVFHWDGEDEQLKQYAPRGYTDEHGRFEIKTFYEGDGAPTGTFKVCVVWRKLPRDVKYEECGRAVLLSFPDVLQGRFDDPAETPLKVTIGEQVNELPALELHPTTKVVRKSQQ